MNSSHQLESEIPEYCVFAVWCSVVISSFCVSHQVAALEPEDLWEGHSRKVSFLTCQEESVPRFVVMPFVVMKLELLPLMVLVVVVLE